MIKVYKDNGLPFATSDFIRDRNYIQQFLFDEMEKLLRGANPQWRMEQIEAPVLMPADLTSKEYGRSDVFIETGYNFVLKPETTASSYAFAEYLVGHQEAKPPLCIWQASKSFRRENDQPMQHMRLKEFYQQEFQCIVTEDTKFDYLTLAGRLNNHIGQFLRRSTRVVDSDRLPSYSEKTIDIEVRTPKKWLEICSISRRTDVPFEWNGKKLINFEFAFGLDRVTYTKRLERISEFNGTK